MRYAIIVGALSNKGSRAMIHITADRLSQLLPDHQIVVLVSDHNLIKDRLPLYQLEILPWKHQTRLSFLGSFWQFFASILSLKKNKDEQAVRERIRKILEQADFAFDVSGFVLSSQWPLFYSTRFLANIAVMKKYKIKTFLLPQSFGPFNYPYPAKWLIFPALRALLPYPDRIYSREKAGIRYMNRFVDENLVYWPDLVLLSKSYDMELSYKTKPDDCPNWDIPQGSIAIVPNKRIMQYGEKNLLNTYQILVSHLLNQNRTLYVLWHSKADYGIWKKLRDTLEPHPRLIFSELDPDAHEMPGLFSRFDLVISARYHALVHSYKAGTPALVLGWSDKYGELMALLGQEAYLCDVRGNFNHNDLLDTLDNLLNKRAIEAETIRTRLAALQESHDLFGDIRSRIEMTDPA